MSLASLSADIESTDNPFPGLRPFEFHENHLFFGREGQSEALLVKLSKTHFLAVVGTSGSGKSSLVRAGLLPALYGGLMGKAGSGWRVALLRPGNDPIGNLARALNECAATEQEGDEVRYVQTYVTLMRGSMGLVEVVRHARLESHENLLVVVDQFEELFRFARISEDEEYANNAAAFVKLLLEARRQKSNIYVVLTMRSDYLGDCAQFWDLPEAINEGQYLIPRMTRDQRRAAIIGPLGVRSATITPGLVNQLLNDMGDNPDQLPILQHALMRIWEKWREEGQEDSPLDLQHYVKIGGLSETLSRHADQAYDELPDDAAREVAEKLFKCLTEKGADDRETRRPTELVEICLITGASREQVVAVIDVFRREGRSFLMPGASVPLEGNTSIDISHESLIRSWQRLKKWVEEEAYSGRVYRRLADDAIFYSEGGLLRGHRLQEALDWYEHNRPNLAWASHHHAAFYRSPEFARMSKTALDERVFKRAMDFLKESKSEHDREIKEREELRRKEVKHARQFAVGLASVLLIISGLAIFAFVQRKRAEDLTYRANLLTYRSNMYLAQKAYERGRFGETNQWLSSLIPISEQEDLRGFDWYYLWRASHYERGTLKGHSGEVLSVAVSADRVIASGSADKTVKLWNANTGELIRVLNGHTNGVSSVTFSPDGKVLATGSADTTVKLWDVATGAELGSLKGHTGTVWSVTFSPNGKLLATGSADHTIKVWEAATREVLKTLTGHADEVLSVAISPDNELLASGSVDRTAKLWNISLGNTLTTLSGQTNAILSVAFSPDGKRLATGSFDGSVKLWDTSWWEPVRQQELAALGNGLNGVRSMAFSPDGRMMATGREKASVDLWLVATPEQVEAQRQ
jgi:energy-coupling factor transporter ATP-binding protein EcfA2